MDRNLPPLPTPPPCRVEYESIFGSLFFQSMEELEQWRAEPLWRRMFGLTAYDRRMRACG